MGLLDRLDDRVLGARRQPADPRRIPAGHWFDVAITLELVVAGLVTSGSSNPAIWHLAGTALGSFLFGGRAVASQRPVKPNTTAANAQQGDDPKRQTSASERRAIAVPKPSTICKSQTSAEDYLRRVASWRTTGIGQIPAVDVHTALREYFNRLDGPP